MDLLDSLFRDIRAINTHIRAQDIQLEKALQDVPGKNKKSKPKLTKSRAALPVPGSKSKAPLKKSMPRLPSTKSKLSIGKSKSSKVITKRKPMLPPTNNKAVRGSQSQLKPLKSLSKRKEALPYGNKSMVKRSYVQKEVSPYVGHSGALNPVPPAAKKPPTLTDGGYSRFQLRKEFRQHMDEIEKMKDLLSDSKEENEVLSEVNGMVSKLLNKSQGHLAKADYSLRTADQQAPTHYKNIIRKLLYNQSKTSIVMSAKAPPRKVPIYKKLHINYSDKTQKDLDDLLAKHPSSDPTTNRGRSEFNFPDIFDKIYSKPMDSGKKAVPKSSSDKEFDLTMFSPSRLIERAQQSLTSAISSEAIESFRRDGHLSPSPSGISYSSPVKSSMFTPSRAPLKAEEDLDVLVQDVINSVNKHSKRLEVTGPAPASLTSPLSISTSHLTPVYGQDSDVTSSSLLHIQPTPTSSGFPSTFPTIDEDLALLTPSLFTRNDVGSLTENKDKDMDFEMELIRSSNRSERERINGQMNAMRSKLDDLISGSSPVRKPADSDDDDFLPKLGHIQTKSEDAALSEHEDLLHKVVKALMKKANYDSSGQAIPSVTASSSVDADAAGEKKSKRHSKKAGEEGSSESKDQPTTSHVPAPPSTSPSARARQTPRTKKISRAISLSTMHEEENEGDDDSEVTTSSRKSSHSRSSSKKRKSTS